MQITRNELKEKIMNSNIILWGNTQLARAFYDEYKEVLSIAGCVTEESKHPMYLNEEKQQVPIIMWKDYKHNEKDYIIITKSPFVYGLNQLIASHLEMFNDFVDYNTCRATLTNKKIVILAGNCHMQVIFQLMLKIKSLRDKYFICYFPIHLHANRWSWIWLSHVKSYCELYICNRHGDEDARYFSKEELPPDCKIVVIPSALIRLYWPQMKVSWKGAHNEYFIVNKENKKHGPFEFGDTNINRMIAEGKDVEEVVETLMSEDFYTEKQAKKHIESIIRMLEYEEEGCDIKLSPYILGNYQKKMLYRDMAHIEKDLIWEMVRCILEYIHVDITESTELLYDADDFSDSIYKGHCTEVPVYPSIAKHLGLEWCTKDTLYEVTFYNGIKKMTFEEYVRAYYSICSKMSQIQEEW